MANLYIASLKLKIKAYRDFRRPRWTTVKSNDWRTRTFRNCYLGGGLPNIFYFLLDPSGYDSQFKDCATIFHFLGEITNYLEDHSI